MGLRSKFAVASVLVLAALTVAAISAFAAATSNKDEWYTGAKESTVTTLTGKQSLTVSAAEKIKMEFPWGGFPIVMQANAVSCVECFINNEFSAPGLATGTGTLVFSEAGFIEPPICRLKENKFTSEPLRFEAHYSAGERWMLRISPAAGETDFVLNVEPVSGEYNCPLVSTMLVKGVNFGEFKGKTGSFALEQPVLFSPAISESGGSSWTLGPWQFAFTGILNLKAGGNYFGVK